MHRATFGISESVISYNVSVIIVSIAMVSMSIIVSASIVMVVESTAASSEGLLVQDAKAIMPATNANASTFFIFVVFIRLVMQKYYLKTNYKLFGIVFF